MTKFKLTITPPSDSEETSLVAFVDEIANEHSLDMHENQSHGMFEVPGLLELLLSGTATVSLGVLSSALFEKLKKNSPQRDGLELRKIERLKIEILDPASGLRIRIVQEASSQSSGSKGQA